MLKKWMPWLLAIALILGSAMPAMAAEQNRYQGLSMEELRAESLVLLQAMTDVDPMAIAIPTEIPAETRMLLELLIAQIAAMAEERDAGRATMDGAGNQAEIEQLRLQVETLTRERDEARGMQATQSPDAQATQSPDAQATQAQTTQTPGVSADMEGLNIQIETLTRERDEARAALQNVGDQGELEELRMQVETLTRERDEAWSRQEGMVARDEFDVQIADLTRERDEARLALEGAIDRTEADRLNAEIETLRRERDAAIAAGRELRFGLGMVTSIGDVEAAAADRNGYAQVNTVVAGVLLDDDNRIVDIEWDVQRTTVQVSAAGEPIDYVPGELRRLDDDNAFGLRGNAANRAWIEPLEDFEEFVIGMTADEVLAIDFDTPAEGRPDLPEIALSEGGFVSVTRADYMEALRQAVEDAD
ncbi:MAG TPA: hypothetical protein VLA21_09950 [Candidatus Limnocylindria bacterium]|nr:hypothetical protein [Candidatus Limnocylindria bacterium]